MNVKQTFSWYAIARKEVGTRELIGNADHPRIVEYHSATTLRATDDEVPWCSSFVNWCMQQAGYTGTRSAAAKSWLSWGRAIPAPVHGCIVVLTRPGGNHVALFERMDDVHVWLLGGNQDDAVNVRRYLRSRIIGYRMPNKMTMDDDATLALLAHQQNG